METVSKSIRTNQSLCVGITNIVITVGTGIILTVRLKGLQFSKLLYAHKLAFKNQKIHLPLEILATSKHL